MAGEPWLAGMPGSVKFADLRRDPRFALHSGSSEPDAFDGRRQAQRPRRRRSSIRRRAPRYAAAAGIPAEHMGFELFRVDLEQVVLVALNDEKNALVISSWRPGPRARPDDRPRPDRVTARFHVELVTSVSGPRPRAADQTGSSRTEETAMPEPHLRAADTDRAAVATVLGEHMAAGRLTVAEYDERLARAYAARTYGELDAADRRPPAAADGRRAGRRHAGTRRAACGRLRPPARWGRRPGATPGGPGCAPR